MRNYESIYNFKINGIKLMKGDDKQKEINKEIKEINSLLKGLRNHHNYCYKILKTTKRRYEIIKQIKRTKKQITDLKSAKAKIRALI